MVVQARQTFCSDIPLDYCKLQLLRAMIFPLNQLFFFHIKKFSNSSFSVCIVSFDMLCIGSVRSYGYTNPCSMHLLPLVYKQQVCVTGSARIPYVSSFFEFLYLKWSTKVFFFF